MTSVPQRKLGNRPSDSVDTRFLNDATAAGLVCISGLELFIGQGIDAWCLFSGDAVDENRLRASLFGKRGLAL
jgi:shikimate 5-dehydrogenase